MSKLTKYLKITKGVRVLDLACGRGRHSIYLSTLGYKVTGADLSENSIAYAKKFENKNLTFMVHDMTQPTGKDFDTILNLFTSFGYFEKEEDNLNTLKSIKKDLKPGGRAVIDFMNVHFVSKGLVREEVKVVDKIEFHIKRWIKNGFLYKNIRFKIEDENYDFTETVKMITLEHFQKYATKSGLEIIDTFGNYNLDRFYEKCSERLIVIFK
ncbi:class I SAM-dependent methyltransferase [Gangjinia marincola]|uniref:Class I SAM-dependent methyltransferase n=2 Tax=Gangjinia marincola TaxID=578463 RepID=A0ABN1MGJ0_9FLAO